MLSSLGAIFAISPFKNTDDRLTQLSERLEALSQVSLDTIPGAGNARSLADPLIIPILTGFPFCETFRGTDLRNNIEFGGINNQVRLTGDDTGLQLTSNGTNENGYMYVNIPFSSKFGLKVSFEYSSFGGIPDALGRRADGVSFFLFDRTITPSEFSIGGTGGALGYTAVRATAAEGVLISPGLKEAYLGIGFDELGNFGNSRTGKYGGFEDPDNDDVLTGTLLFPHSVVVRGPVDGPPADPLTPFKDWDRVNNSKNFTPPSIAPPRYDSYRFIAGRIFDPASNGDYGTFPPNQVSVPQYLNDPERFEFDTNSFITDCNIEGFRKVFIDLKPNGTGYKLKVQMLVNAPLIGQTLINVFDGYPGADPEGYIDYDDESPELLKVGFAAATGAGTNFHNIRNVTVQVSDEEALTEPTTNLLSGDLCEGETNSFVLPEIILKNEDPNGFIRCIQLYESELAAEAVLIQNEASIPFPPDANIDLCNGGNCFDYLCRQDRLQILDAKDASGVSAGKFTLVLELEGGVEVPKVKFEGNPNYSGIVKVWYTATDNFGQVSLAQPITITINPNPEPIVTTSDPLVWERQEELNNEISVLWDSGVTGLNYTYQWFRGIDPIGGADETTYLATEPGEYSVKVTTGNGCVGFSANAITIRLVADLNPDLTKTRETCVELGTIQVTLENAPVSAGSSDGEKWRIVDNAGNVVVDWRFFNIGQDIINYPGPGDLIGLPPGVYPGLPAGAYVFQIGDNFRPDLSNPQRFRHELTFTIEDIEFPLEITSVVMDPELCFDEGGTITVEGAGGGDPSNYVFTITSLLPTYSASVSGTAQAIFTDLPQGTYSIELRSGTRCLVNETAIVTGPSAPLTISLIDSDGTSCSVATSASASWEVLGGTPNYTFVSLTKGGTAVTSPSLTQNAGVFAFTNLTIGEYILTVKDANGCQIVSQPVQLVDIPAPDFEVADAVACEGDAVTLQPIILDISNSVPVFTWKTPNGTVVTNNSTVAGVTYIFSDHDSNSSTPDQLSISGLSAGTYPYTLSVSGDNTCDFGDLPVTVTVSEYPPVADVVRTNLSCFEDTSGELEIVMATGVDPAAFSYEIVGVRPVQDSPKFTSLPAGDYQIRVINKVTSCETILNNNEITQPDLLQLVELNYTDPSCSFPNGTISFSILGGTPAYQVQVNGNPISDYNPTISGNAYLIKDLAIGTYSIQVEDALLCTPVSPTITLVNDELDPVSTVDIAEEICSGDEVKFTPQITTPGAYTVSWFKDSNATTPITTNSAPDTDGLSYLISSADNSLTISGLQEGSFSYYYRVEGSRLCPDYIFEANATVFPELEATVSFTNEICFGAEDGTITVVATGANGDYEYSLNGNPFVTSNVFSNLSPGTYAIEIRSTNGCSIDETATIEGPAAPISVNTPDILPANCGLPNGIIRNLIISGGWGSYQVEWRKGSATGTPIPGDEKGATDLFPDDYFLIVTDLNGCIETFEFNVEESSDPVYELILPQSICEGNDVSITPVHLAPDPSLPPAAPTEVKWFKNPGQQDEISTGVDSQNPDVSYIIDDSDWVNPKITISGLVDGSYTYYFYVVCTGVELPVEVSVLPTPEVTFDVLSISCFGSADGRISIASGEDPNYVYSINGAGFVNQATLEATLFTAGTYTISVEQKGVGCPSELYALEILSPAEALAVDATPIDPSCEAATGKVLGKIVGGWSPYTVSLVEGGVVKKTQTSTDGSFEFDALLEGVFEVKIVDTRGCDSTAPLVTLTFGPTRIDVEDITICEGDIAVLKPSMAPFNAAGEFKWYLDSNKTQEIISSASPATDGKTYQISPQGELTIEGITPSASPQIYYVAVVGPGICEGFLGSPKVTMLTKPLIAPSVTQEACFEEKGLITVSASLGNGTYTYSLDGISYSSSNLFKVSPGIYSVFVASGGCISRKDNIEVLGPNSALKIDDIQSADPTCNTSSGSISVAFSGGYAVGYTVNLISQGTVVATQNSASPLDFIDLPAGIYSLEISDGSCTIVSDTIELISQNTPIQANDVVICEGEIAALVPSTTQVAGTPEFLWYADANGNQPILDGSTIDGATVQIGANGELNISGLTADETAYTYYVTIQGPGICPPDLLAVKVQVNAIANLRVSNPSIVCDPSETVDLRNYIEGFNSTEYDYMIENPAGQVMRMEDIDAVYQTGDYVVRTSFKASGCWSPLQRIRVIISDELLIPYFSYEADLGGGILVKDAEIQILEDVLFNDLTTGKVVIWNWDFGDGFNSSEQNPSHQYQKKGIYTITLNTIDEFGCMAQIQKTVQVFDDYLVMIPNAFTPTGAKNQYFKPVYRGIVEMEFYIFNLWGELIYHATSLEDPGWDGFLNSKPVIPGNYVYKGTFKTKSGEKLQKAGTFVLIR